MVWVVKKGSIVLSDVKLCAFIQGHNKNSLLPFCHILQSSHNADFIENRNMTERHYLFPLVIFCDIQSILEITRSNLKILIAFIASILNELEVPCA